MKKATSKRRTAQPRLDIELHDLNAYKRCNDEYCSLAVLTEQLDEYRERFDCRDSDHEPNLKFVDLETKQKFHLQLQELAKTMDDMTNQLYSAAHKQIRAQRLNY